MAEAMFASMAEEMAEAMAEVHVIVLEQRHLDRVAGGFVDGKAEWELFVPDP